MNKKININFEKETHLSYCDENTQINKMGKCDYKKNQKYKWFVFVNKNIENYNEGAIIIAEYDNDVLYFDEFEKYINNKYKKH